MRSFITTVIVSLVSSLSIFRADITVDAFSMSMSTSNGNKSISVSKSVPTSTSTSTSTSTPTLTTTNTKNMMNRRTIFTKILQSTTAASILTFTLEPSNNTKAKANAIAIPEQKSYSSNARNMDRLSSGDSSGGSLYNNSPDTAVASKRRAMVGCKVTPSRVEASRIENEANDNGNDSGSGSGGKSGFGFLNNGVISEKDCNMRVMGGDSEFMLKAMRNLDCPTCPYGIEGA